MGTRQTEAKITALYERLSRDDELAGTATRSSIKKFSSKNMPPAKALPTASIIRTMDGVAAILTVQAGNG